MNKEQQEQDIYDVVSCLIVSVIESAVSEYEHQIASENDLKRKMQNKDAPYIHLEESLQKANPYTHGQQEQSFTATLGQFLTCTTNSTGTFCHFYKDNYIDGNTMFEASREGNKYITDYKDERCHGWSEEYCYLQISAKPIKDRKPKSIKERLVKLLTRCFSKKTNKMNKS